MLPFWQRLQNAPSKRVNHQSIIIQDKMYIFGGYNSQLNKMPNVPMQMDILAYDLIDSKWIKITHPLECKLWDCSTKTFTSVNSWQMSTDVPCSRFGHTMVTWRGRGWLFGGRSIQTVCSTEIFMFDPGFPTPFWSKICGIQGSPPNPQDGHAAAVLEDAMFVFGGFDDRFTRYTNNMYRLNFITWEWSKITVISRVPRSVNEHSTGSQNVLKPMPRDFAALIAHQGRLFLFGGRCHISDYQNDVYESTLWELSPVVFFNNDDCTKMNEIKTTISPGTLDRVLWEEATGNWLSKSELWHTPKSKPYCLWHHKSSSNKTVLNQVEHVNELSSTYHSNHSAWDSGFGKWHKVHPGCGDFVSSNMLAKLLNAGIIDSDEFFDSQQQAHQCFDFQSAPFGRRSLSSWAYQGNIYIAFGIWRNKSQLPFKIYFNDVWRFSLADSKWYIVSSPRDSTLNMHDPSQWQSGRQYSSTGYPPARRRASAILYWPYQSHYTWKANGSQVIIYGGTQPQHLSNLNAYIENPLGMHSKTLTIINPLNFPSTQFYCPQNNQSIICDQTVKIHLLIESFADCLVFILVSHTQLFSQVHFNLLAFRPSVGENVSDVLFAAPLVILASVDEIISDTDKLLIDVLSAINCNEMTSKFITQLLEVAKLTIKNWPLNLNLDGKIVDKLDDNLSISIIEWRNNKNGLASSSNQSSAFSSNNESVSFSLCTMPSSLNNPSNQGQTVFNELFQVVNTFIDFITHVPENEMPKSSVDEKIVILNTKMNQLDCVIRCQLNTIQFTSVRCLIRNSEWLTPTTNIKVRALQSVFNRIILLNTNNASNHSSLLVTSNANEDIGSIDSSTSYDSDTEIKERCTFVSNVGYVTRGRESLVQLNDCYVLYLDATLYQMCLRSVVKICTNVNALSKILSSQICKDLNSLNP